MKAFFLVFLIAAMAMTDQSNPLSAYRWEHRIILIVDDGSVTAAAQIKRFVGETAELEDRDLLLMVMKGAEIRLQEEPTDIRTEDVCKSFNLNNESFTILLIGKDGGVKNRSSEVVLPTDIYGLIDQMPMRRAEIRSRGN